MRACFAGTGQHFMQWVQLLCVLRSCQFQLPSLQSSFQNSAIPHPFSFLPQRQQWWLRALATIWVKLSCLFSWLFHHLNQWSQTNTLFKMSDTWNVFCFPDTVTFSIQRQWPRRSSGLIVYILKGKQHLGNGMTFKKTFTCTESAALFSNRRISKLQEAHTELIKTKPQHLHLYPKIRILPSVLLYGKASCDISLFSLWISRDSVDGIIRALSH